MAKEQIPNLDKFLNGNPNDILLVCNPDLNCEDIDSVEGWSHKDYFQVKWDGIPHRIVPGQTRRMPRWLSLHYAKHLADHLLMKEEEETGKKGLVQSPVRRPQILATILLSVEEYFGEPEEVSEGKKVEKEVEELNLPSTEPANPLTQAIGGGRSMELSEVSIGEVPSSTLGVLKSEQKIEEIMKEAGKPEEAKASIWDPSRPKPTRKELLEECEKMGIETTGKEKIDDLIALLKKF